MSVTAEQRTDARGQGGSKENVLSELEANMNRAVGPCVIGIATTGEQFGPVTLPVQENVSRGCPVMHLVLTVGESYDQGVKRSPNPCSGLVSPRDGPISASSTRSLRL